MAENLRQGDRVEWHNRPQFTADPCDVKRTAGNRITGREPVAEDDAERPNAPERR